jgi:hypothetical protein
MMLVPNSIAEELETKDIFGLQALNEIRNGKADGTAASPQKSKKKESSN